MTFRTGFVLSAATWVTVVAALLAGVPLLFRERLPEPVAVHWGVSGAPDNAMPLGAVIAIPIAMWVVLAGAVLVTAWRGGALQRRRRSWHGAALAWGGAFVLGLMALTVWANLDADAWSRARSVTWPTLLFFPASLLAGWLGWLVARPGPDEVTESGSRTPSLRLPPGERAVWVSSSGIGAGLMSAALASLSMAVVAAIAMALGVVVLWTALGVFALAGLVCLAVSAVHVQVTERGLAIAFGLLRWPVRRVPMERIDSARAEVRRPSEVGGWGIRGLPGRSTIMIRSGECLVVRYTSGGELGISVDDAERGAALINTLAGDHVDH